MERLSRWWKIWTSVILYTISLILYFIDMISDILLGKYLINNEGLIILGLMFLPVIATFFLVFFKRCCGKPYKEMFKKDPGYRLTLLGIDWLNIDGGNKCNITFTVVLIILRLDIIRVYVLLIKAAVTNDKKLKKGLDTRIRAEMFLETCFESLPQCCVQLYLFGHYSTVSNLQIVSFTLSTLNLVYTFTLAHAEREIEIYHNGPKHNLKMFDIDANHPAEDEEEEQGLTRNSKRQGKMKISKVDQSIILKMMNLGNPPAKKISMTLDLVRQKKSNKYDVSFARIRSKQLSIKIEQTFFFWMRVVNIFIESPVFFLTAFPSISLFASMFGSRFLLLYIPIAFHFVAEYWWWRPYVYKFVMNGSFHTMFLAFKLLERFMILGMICIWCIKVINYSKPKVPRVPTILPSLVWPEPNPFLLAISMYEKDDVSKEWAKECTQLHETILVVSVKNENHLMKAYRRFTQTSICAIDASIYILCVVYYMNLIGMVWEMVNYLVFWIFKWITKYETWKDSNHIHDSGKRTFFRQLFEYLFEGKILMAAEFMETQNL